jgi:adenine deaminase
MATINTALHYNLRSMGAIAPGYKADMVVVNNLEELNIEMVIKDSRVVAENETIVAPFEGIYRNPPESGGRMNLPDYAIETFRIPALSESIRVIGMRENDLYTDSLVMDAKISNGHAVADPSRDFVKVVILDRYNGVHMARAFAKGFGIRKGAIATTIGHDAHNLCVVGVNDKDMFQAVRRIEELSGGIVAVIDGKVRAEIALPIAGLMSNNDLNAVVSDLEEMKRAVAVMGSDKDILMVLHFIQLAVIPEIRITDRGLVNVLEQRYIDLFLK